MVNYREDAAKKEDTPKDGSIDVFLELLDDLKEENGQPPSAEGLAEVTGLSKPKRFWMRSEERSAGF